MIMVSNKALNRSMLIMAKCCNSFLAFLFWHFAPSVLASEEVSQITFKLERTHMEATVGQVLEAVGYNMTIFEPLDNGTIIVNATRLET
jgi:hypothetical protein